MVKNNSLDNRIISLSFRKSNLQVTSLQPISNLLAINIDSSIFYFQLKILLMCSILRPRFLNNVHVGNHNSVSNFYVKNSLPRFFEVHLYKD